MLCGQNMFPPILCYYVVSDLNLDFKRLELKVDA